MVYEEVDFQKAIAGNPSFNTISKANLKTEDFYIDLDNGQDFEFVVNKYVPRISVMKKVKNKIKKIVKRILK